MSSETVHYQINGSIDNALLNALFSAAWPHHTTNDFGAQLRHSLCYITAHTGEHMVGFVNVAWDGGNHAFILDTTVHPTMQRHGIGVALVQHAAAFAQARGVTWLHVDFEPHLRPFYARCGFVPTEAGLLRLG